MSAGVYSAQTAPSRCARPRPGLLDAHARPQAPDDAQMVAPRPSLSSHVVLQRRPDLGRGRQDILEAARHDADDQVAAVVELDLSADDGRIAAEAPPPERVAQDHDVGSVGTIVGRHRSRGPALGAMPSTAK